MVHENKMEQKPPEQSIPPERQLPEHAGEATKPPVKKRRQWLWIVLLLVFAGILYLILQHQSTTKTAAGGGRHGFSGPVTLTVATAQKGDIGVYLEAIGTVTPVYTASIYNQVIGVITQVHYREGQTVQKGAPLVDIDPRQFQAQVESAEGALARDTGLLDQAQMDLDRYQKAWARNAIAKQILDDQEKLVAQDQGLVKSDQGTLDFDKVQLAYCHIVAPFTGRVGLRLVDPGNLVQSSGSTVLAVVAQIQPITVVFTLAEDHLSIRARENAKEVDMFGVGHDRRGSQLAGRLHAEARHQQVAETEQQSKPGRRLAQYRARQIIDPLCGAGRLEAYRKGVRQVGSLEQRGDAALGWQGNGPNLLMSALFPSRRHRCLLSGSGGGPRDQPLASFINHFRRGLQGCPSLTEPRPPRYRYRNSGETRVDTSAGFSRAISSLFQRPAGRMARRAGAHRPCRRGRGNGGARRRDR